MVTCNIFLNAERLLPTNWKYFKRRDVSAYKKMKEAVKTHGKNRIRIGCNDDLKPLAILVTQ